jgi:hypothetical protein
VCSSCVPCHDGPCLHLYNTISHESIDHILWLQVAPKRAALKAAQDELADTMARLAEAQVRV